MDTLFLNEHARLKSKTKLKKVSCEDHVKLKNTNVKTLLNDHTQLKKSN